MAKEQKRNLEPPEFVTGDALAEWHRIVAITGIDEPGKRAVLATYCINWARWKQSECELTENGAEIQIRDDKGTLKNCIPSPWIGIGVKANDRMLKAARELGIGAATGVGDREVTVSKVELEKSRNWLTQ